MIFYFGRLLPSIERPKDEHVKSNRGTLKNSLSPERMDAGMEDSK